MPELYEAWGTESFDEVYKVAERKTSVSKTKVNAQTLIMDMLKERAETGRIYIMNIDHCNTHSSFKDRILMSNLCQEITLPTEPLQHIDQEGEIALCILSAINVGLIDKRDELEPLCDLAVRALDEIIDNGIVVCQSAGNTSYKVDIQGGLDYDNYYNSSLYGRIHYHRGISPKSPDAILNWASDNNLDYIAGFCSYWEESYVLTGCLLSTFSDRFVTFRSISFTKSVVSLILVPF